jgi:diguanylate cyclase (GGDEF)-like protein
MQGAKIAKCCPDFVGLCRGLRKAVRQTDVVARLGGDEFALIRHNAPHIDQNDTLSQRILRDLHQPFDLQGQKLRIGASVGIAIAPNAGSTADAIMKHADVALYCAKTSAPGNPRSVSTR